MPPSDLHSNPIGYPIANLNALKQFAKKLAQQLKPGDVLALSGDMGAGKTTLTQAIGRQLGITEKMTSPTFVLIHDYLSGHLPLVHADLYRLGDSDSESIQEELINVIQDKQSLLIVEWAEYGQYLQPFITLAIHIESPEPEFDSDTQELILPETRTLHITSNDSRFETFSVPSNS